MSMRNLKFVALHGISGARLPVSGELGLTLHTSSLGELVTAEMAAGVTVTAIVQGEST